MFSDLLLNSCKKNKKFRGIVGHDSGLRGQIFFRSLFRENQSVSRLRSSVTVLLCDKDGHASLCPSLLTTWVAGFIPH